MRFFRDDAPRSEKIVFFLGSISFLYLWASFSVHVARQWYGIDVHLHAPAFGLALMPFVLWLYLFRVKNSGICVALNCFAFWAASHLARQLF